MHVKCSVRDARLSMEVQVLGTRAPAVQAGSRQANAETMLHV